MLESRTDVLMVFGSSGARLAVDVQRLKNPLFLVPAHLKGTSFGCTRYDRLAILINGKTRASSAPQKSSGEDKTEIV